MEDPNQNFVRLLSKHHLAIWNYIYAMHPNHADVDDIMQETASALWNRFSEFDSQKGAFQNWAFRFAYFEVLRFRKTKSRSKLVFCDEVIEMISETYEEKHDELIQRQTQLQYCIQKLGKTDQYLLARRYNKETRMSEVAKVLNLPIRKIYKRLEQLRLILFECVDRNLNQQRQHS